MLSALNFYTRFLGLFVLLSLIVGGHYAFRGFHRISMEVPAQVPVARPERGPELIRAYGCVSCHVVPGVVGATGKVGPRLDHVREQTYIAGVLPSSPQNLAAWIRLPRKFAPQTAMPNLGVSEEDARDMAAYLSGLR